MSKNEARQAAASAYLDSQGALSALNALNGVDKTGLNTSVQEDPELSAKALGMVGELAELEVNEENAKKIEKYILSDSFHETDIPSYTQGFAGFLTRKFRADSRTYDSEGANPYAPASREDRPSMQKVTNAS